MYVTHPTEIICLNISLFEQFQSGFGFSVQRAVEFEFVTRPALQFVPFSCDWMVEHQSLRNKLNVCTGELINILC